MSLADLVLQSTISAKPLDEDGNLAYDEADDANIIEFIEAPWGLGARLFPVQRVILKAHYGLALDDNPHGFDLSKPIPEDHPNYDPALVDKRGLYKLRVPISDWRRETWTVYSEAEYLRKLYDEGRCNIKEVIPGQQRREMVLSVGRRSGKSFISACVCVYENYKLLRKYDPHKYYGISASNPIQLIAVATGSDQAGLLYNDVSGHFKKCGFFSAYMANNTQSYARFQTPKDIEDTCRYNEDPKSAKASIKVTFSSCIAKGLRGAGNMVIILDELAHFTDNTSQSSGESVYNAVAPSKSAFSPKDEYGMPIGEVESRLISISSPFGRAGFFYELFQVGMKGAEGMLCVQAPTWEVNPTIPASEFEPHFIKNAAVFFTEYGAHFSDRTKGWIDEPEVLISCIDPKRRALIQAPPRRPHFMGVDFGLSNDATAVAIGHLETINGENKVVVDLVAQKQAGYGDFEDVPRLEFDDMADWILELSKRFYIQEGIFDQWAGVIFEQALHKRGLRQMRSAKLSRAESYAMFRNFKDLMYESKLVLYDWPKPNGADHCSYISELLTLQEERVSQTVSVIQAPQSDGFHDDQSDALVRMCYLATNSMSKSAQYSVVGAHAPRAQASSMKGLVRARMKARRSGSHPSRMVRKKRRRY